MNFCAAQNEMLTMRPLFCSAIWRLATREAHQAERAADADHRVPAPHRLVPHRIDPGEGIAALGDDFLHLLVAGPGVVDEDVEAALGGDHVRDQRLGLAVAGVVHAMGDEPAREGLRLGRQSVERARPVERVAAFGLGAGAGMDRCAGLQQPEYDALADASARARNNADLAPEIDHRPLPPCDSRGERSRNIAARSRLFSPGSFYGVSTRSMQVIEADFVCDIDESRVGALGPPLVLARHVAGTRGGQHVDEDDVEAVDRHDGEEVLPGVDVLDLEGGYALALVGDRLPLGVAAEVDHHLRRGCSALVGDAENGRESSCGDVVHETPFSS